MVWANLPKLAPAASKMMLVPEPVENARCIGEEVGVIEGVEELGAEGQLMTLVKLKGASDASVVKPLARTDVRIAAEIPCTPTAGMMKWKVEAG